MPRLVPLAAFAALSVFATLAGASGLAVQVKDAAGKPLSDAVIWAEPEGGSAPKPLHQAEIEQRGLKFRPLVTVIQVGSKIFFPNNDKVRHHIYSFSPAKKFDQKLYSGVAAPPQVFDKVGTVVLGCNIHDRMVAYVKVVDTPYFAKTDADGVARIEIPAGGKYTVKAWHYNMLAASVPDQTATIKAGDAAGAMSFSIAVKPPAPEGDDAEAVY